MKNRSAGFPALNANRSTLSLCRRTHLPSRFVPNPWPAITAAVKRAPGRSDVAVAYFAEGASDLLPLRRGSVLIVDASDVSVKAGRTCPSELRKLMNRGVEIHSMANLHAKVFVTPTVVFVGSANVSRRSKLLLLEAAMTSTDVRIIAAARQWVRSLAALEIGPKEIERLESIYRPPRFPPGAGIPTRRRSGPRPHQSHATWLVKTQLREWSDPEHAAWTEGINTAQSRLSNRRQFQVDSFAWNQSLAQLRRGDVVVVAEIGPRGEFVSAPGKVLHVVPVRGRKQKVIFFERPRSLRRRTSRTVQKLLGTTNARLFKRIQGGTRVGSSWAHDLLRAAGRPSTAG
jgi:hypothetical protein